MRSRRGTEAKVPRTREEEDEEDEEEEEVEEEDEDEDNFESDSEGGRQKKRRLAEDEAVKSLAEQSKETFVAFSPWDKCPRAQLSSDRLQLSGVKGFRSARVNHGVSQGKWFCEMVVEKASTNPEDEGHVRVGWTQGLARVDGPVGMCKLGYGLRDVDGSKIHDGWRTKYAESGFTQGDVVGMIIDLDSPQTSIRFMKNGKDLGVAFKDILKPDQHGYFATASVYQNATVRLNPGPSFQFPPEDKDFNSLSEAAPRTQENTNSRE